MHDTIDEGDRAFIEARDMFFLATADEDGSPHAPTRAASPASCACSTSRRSPSRVWDGNGMYLSLGNLS